MFYSISKCKIVFKFFLSFRKSVILGEHNKATTIDCVDNECAPPTQTIDIESFLVHPGYNTNTKVHDIAIIRLKKDADVTKGNFTFKKNVILQINCKQNLQIT